MNKRCGMSAIGYAIATVILIGIVMIFSAPMIVDSYNMDSGKKNNKNNNITPAAPAPAPQHYPVNNSSANQDYMNVAQEIRNLEERLTMRISDLEQKQANNDRMQSQESDVTDKYVCSIEGLLAENGDVVPLNDSHIENTTAKKFVFVCEYKK